MRASIAICAALLLACGSQPSANAPAAGGNESESSAQPRVDAEVFGRWQDAFERQIEADARAGTTRKFASLEEFEQFMHSLSPAAFRPRPEFFASLTPPDADLVAYAEQMAAYARAHPDEVDRRLEAFKGRLGPIFVEIADNARRQFPDQLAAPAPAGRWRSDPDAALAEARRLERAAVIVFGAAWLAASQELERSLADPAVEKLLDARFVAARVDMSDDQAPETKKHAEKYAVDSLPVIVVFDSEGREVARATRPLSVEDLLGLLDRAR